MENILSNPLPVDIPDISLHDFALKRFAELGNKVALVEGVTGVSYTFAQLLTNIRRVASGLSRLGVKKGDIVAIFSHNNPEYAFIFYAILATGATVTTINPAYTIYEVVRHLKEFNVSVLYTVRDAADTALKAVQQVDGIRHIVCLGDVPNTIPLRELLTDDGSAYPQNVVIDPREDVATLPTSSGTTGLPKGVMITHYNIMAVISIYSHPVYVSDDLPEGRETCTLAILPFFHSFGMIAVLAFGLTRGERVVTLPTFEPESFFRAIEQYRVTYLPVVPPIVLFMEKNPMASKYDLSSLHQVVCGAAPLALGIETDFKNKFDIERVQQGYGLTETTIAVCGHAIDTPIKHGSSGKALPKIDIKIADVESHKALGAYQRGEVWIKGPNVMKGYWNNPQATKETVDDDGWLHTGDIGYYDEEGHIFIVDRLKELIKYKGFQVPPAELEELILTHPSIADVGVIGVPDQRTGELPKAFVVKKPDVTLTDDDLMKYMKERAADYKLPRGGIEFVAAIPKSPSGKILRRELRKLNSKL